MKRLLNLLLVLLGFGGTGCEIIGTAMYGTPNIDFHLSARVVDKDGNPIQGIDVRMKDGQRFNYNSGISDYLGNINASGNMFPRKQYEIVFMDIDGEYNGGEFENLELDVTDKVQQIKKGSGDWYDGSYKAVIGDVTLTLKEHNGEEDNNTNEE